MMGVDHDSASKSMRSSKKDRQRWRYCGITLLAHENMNVLIIIDVSIIIQKIHIQYNSSRIYIINHMSFGTR